MVAANRNDGNQGRGRGNQDPPGQGANVNTSPEEIDAAARRAGVLTIRMIAEQLQISEGTVRGRMQKAKIEPVAKIHPKGRGRFTPGFAPDVVDKLGAEVAEVRVEMIGQDDEEGAEGNQGGRNA